jgi:class 3 adenylate cyclase/tetratricopeptide (TPR) repeat protein
MPACAACGHANPEGAKFCLECGAPFARPGAAEPPAAHEERKLVTVVFTDIVGSTAAAERMDPEDVRARLAPYYSRLRGELVRHGGTVEKFIGDAVVALFGAPVANEDDPERALRAALAIRAAIDELNAEDEWLDLKVRIGVNTGEALVVVGAKAAEGEGMAAGDVMNTAARLQSAAPVDGILVGELTRAAADGSFEFREAEPVVAKGKAQPLRAWEVIGEVDGEPRRQARHELVGRADELEELLGCWETVLEEGRCSLAAVLGPPGIGKSRLLHAFADRVAPQARIHWGRCLAYGEGITYWPMTDLFRSAAAILRSDRAGAVREKLDAFLEGLDTRDLDELRTIAAALSNLFGIPTTPRGTYVAGDMSQAELHWGLRRALQLNSHSTPMVLVLEDLHWAEPTLLELLASIAGDDAIAPILLVCSARPELEQAQPWFVKGARRRPAVRLGALTAEQALELLAHLLGDERLATTPLAARLVENAAGNPLFLQETVRTLRERGLDDEQWANGGVKELPVPTSLRALISSRLDRLPTADKRIAHDASVVGTVFWESAVAHLAATNGDGEVSTRVERLADSEFVRRQPVSTIAGEVEYAFEHILIRDVAYAQIPKGRRAQLHVRFTEWVERLPRGAGAAHLLEIRAWHLEQACRLAREVVRSPIEPPVLAAATTLAEAGHRAERREGLREARRYYTRALDVLGAAEPALALELRLRLVEVDLMLGELGQAREELGPLPAEADALARPDLRCEALLLLGDLDQRQGRAGEAYDLLREATELAQQTGLHALRIKSAFVFSALRADFFPAEYEQAIAGLEEAIALADVLADRPLLADGHLRLGAILLNRGRLAAAEDELRTCLALANELGSRRLEAEAMCWLGRVEYFRGRIDAGTRTCLHARQLLERTADTYFQVQNLVDGLALFAILERRPVDAERWLLEALPIAVQIGGWSVLEVYRYLAEALVEQGRIDDAREIVEFAARDLPEEDPWARVCLLLAQGLVATAGGDDGSAGPAFAEAVRLVEELDMPRELGEAHWTIARALERSGRTGEARVELTTARELLARTEATALVSLVESELTA